MGLFNKIKSERYEKIVELSTWAVLILVIFGVRFLPIKLLDQSSVFILIGAIAAFGLIYYLAVYKYVERSKRVYFKNIADILLIGILIHLLKDYGQYFLALYFLPIAAAALSLEFINALLIATIASLFVIFEIFLSSFNLMPSQINVFQGVWQIGLILFVTIFCRMLAIQLKQEKTAKEASLLRQKNLEEEAVRQKEFLSLTSHQLFTPLSMIRGFVSLLKNENFGKLSNEQKDAVEEIYTNTRRMVDLVSELLSISRIQSNTLEIKKTEVKLGKILADAVDSFKKTLNKNNIEIELNVAENEANTLADEEKIRQVIYNMIDNALKYTHEGKVTASVFQDENTTTIEIRDTGIGFGPNYQEKLFQPFFRGKNILELDNKGTGLGLYIAKIIIDKHGGEIWGKPNVPHGAIFGFKLPREQNQKGEK